MQSLLEQSQHIADLGATLYTPSNDTCRCTAMRACWYHRPLLLRTRRMTREQYRTDAHELRQRRYEAEQQARDEEDFRERYGYSMPYSMRLAAGHAVEEADDLDLD